MKNLANYITISRIFIAFTLLFFKPFGIGFMIIYLLCGLTDILDGIIARRMNITSELGAKLDSIADLVMVVVVIYVLYPLLELSTNIYIWIFLIIAIRSVSIIIVYGRYRTFGIMHTYSNKITGIVLFLTPLLILAIPIDFMALLLCSLGMLSAIEEMIIHLIEKKLDLNRKTLFMTGNKKLKIKIK